MEQMKLIDWEAPREAAERRHREYVAQFRREQAERRSYGLLARRRNKLRVLAEPQDEAEHGVSTKLVFGW